MNFLIAFFFFFSGSKLVRRIDPFLTYASTCNNCALPTLYFILLMTNMKQHISQFKVFQRAYILEKLDKK